MDKENTNLALQDERNENFIRDACERISIKMLPLVENAVENLLQTSPSKGIFAWKEVTEFATPKRRENPKDDQVQKALPNITINMIPAKREKEKKSIDISAEDAQIIED